MKEIQSIIDIETFWNKQAKRIEWFKKWDKVLDWNEPFAKWFVGGKLNASYLCLDYHVQNGRKDKIAIYWEDENGNKKSYTYGQLHKEVNKFSCGLHNLGIAKGDVVIIYLPMIPQAIISMLAVARLGATHCVVFSGFSSQSLQERANETKAKIIITADFGIRRGKNIPLKQIVDQAVPNIPSVKNIILVKRTEEDADTKSEKDILYEDIIKNSSNYLSPVAVESNHPLYILYTSGTTGKPKGIVHSTGGYLVYVYNTFKWCFNVKENDIYWCGADIGWVTGHSYIVYAPLMHGTTIFLYEGAPDTPTPARLWQLIEKYKISIFYTSPTAIRMFKKFGEQWITKNDLSSLRILGSVGEVINPEVWKWYSNKIGNSRCPIVDTWWQTETGGVMIAPRADFKLKDLKPGSACLPLPGIYADVVDENGKSLQANKKGFLVVKKPWPGMALGIYKDKKRYKEVYWSKFKNMYYSGDYAAKDKDGYLWFLGRSDEVLNIASHRVGTCELENAVIETGLVAEAAVVGVPDEIKGENFVIFVSLNDFDVDKELLKTKIVADLRKSIGVLSRPKEIYFVKSLPKTRSGKILRRVLKKIITGQDLGDISTLENQVALQDVQKQIESYL